LQVLLKSGARRDVRDVENKTVIDRAVRTGFWVLGLWFNAYQLKRVLAL
jgi:hypothetical protein